MQSHMPAELIQDELITKIHMRGQIRRIFFLFQKQNLVLMTGKVNAINLQSAIYPQFVFAPNLKSLQ